MNCRPIYPLLSILFPAVASMSKGAISKRTRVCANSEAYLLSGAYGSGGKNRYDSGQDPQLQSQIISESEKRQRRATTFFAQSAYVQQPPNTTTTWLQCVRRCALCRAYVKPNHMRISIFIRRIGAMFVFKVFAFLAENVDHNPHELCCAPIFLYDPRLICDCTPMKPDHKA